MFRAMIQCHEPVGTFTIWKMGADSFPSLCGLSLGIEEFFLKGLSLHLQRALGSDLDNLGVSIPELSCPITPSTFPSRKGQALAKGPVVFVGSSSQGSCFRQLPFCFLTNRAGAEDHTLPNMWLEIPMD